MNNVQVKEDDELLQEELEEDDEELTEEEGGAAFEAPQGLIVGALRAPNTKSVSMTCGLVYGHPMLMQGLSYALVLCPASEWFVIGTRKFNKRVISLTTTLNYQNSCTGGKST